MTDDRIAALEKEVKRLSIKLETLVAYLNSDGKFGPPDGRETFDRWVKQETAKVGL